MSKKYITVAICYDFDGTLIRGNMQENSFIPDLEMDKVEFWNEVKKESKKQDMDEVLSYMELMIRKSIEKEKPFTRESIYKHGQNVTFFPGVEKWFELINSTGKKLKIQVEHYIISSGIDEMIKGSPIGNKFKHIFASGFSYDANDVPKFAARSVNYTTKTQYLFRINKGILNSWDNKVNAFMDEKERPISFSNMIYLGDGETDVPAMKMINYQGGYSIAVYPPPEGKRRNTQESNKKKAVEEMLKRNRVQFISEADYRKKKGIHNIVESLLRRISDEAKHKMNKNS